MGEVNIMIDNKFDEIVMAKLGARLTALGLSGRELAKRIGIPKSNWSSYVTLTRSIPFDTFKKACVVLGLDYEEVFIESQKEFFECEKKTTE